jgi:carbohydrate-selective porin OprB
MRMRSPPTQIRARAHSARTLGLLPNPFEKRGLKFSATYVGESLGNVSGGMRQGVIYEGRLNLAVDVDSARPRNGRASAYTETSFRFTEMGFRANTSETC